jgi:hypothetical protein
MRKISELPNDDDLMFEVANKIETYLLRNGIEFSGFSCNIFDEHKSVSVWNYHRDCSELVVESAKYHKDLISDDYSKERKRAEREIHSALSMCSWRQLNSVTASLIFSKERQ